MCVPIAGLGTSRLPPLFRGQKNLHHALLFDNATVGTLVFQVDITNNLQGLNKNVRYTIAPVYGEPGGIQPFVSTRPPMRDLLTIDHFTGRITTAKRLDFDTLPPPLYHRCVTGFYSVLVTEMGPLHKTAVTYLLLRFCDINDNAPQFVNLKNASSLTTRQRWGVRCLLSRRLMLIDTTAM